MQIKSKQDYLRLGVRVDTHLTVRSDLYEELQILGVRWSEPCGKIIDILIKEYIDNPDKLNELREKVRNYR